MGHGSGLKHVGARGKMVPQTRALMDAELDLDSDEVVRELARAHDVAAIGRLATAVRRRGKDKAPWSVSVKAARDLLEIGHGRSATQDATDKSGGLTVIINQLTSDDQLERVISGVQMAKSVAATIEIEAEPEPEVIDVTPPEDVV